MEPDMPSYTDGAWEYNVNEVRADNRDHLIAFGDLLISAGWTAVASSDGTTPKAGRNSLADWNNNNAWEHFRDPGGALGRDLTIQRSTVPGTIRAWQGRAGIPFTGGSGSVTPTDATALQVIGASGGFAASFLPSTATNARVHMAARSAPLGTTGDVYPWWLVARTTPAGGPNSAVAVIPLLSPYDGSVGDADVEPWVAMSSASSFTVSSSLRGWYRAGLSGASNVSTLVAVEPGSAGNYTGQSPYSVEDDLPPLFVRDATGGVAQRKGVMQEVTGESPARTDLDTFNLATAGQARIQFDQVTLPWPSAVTPLL